VSTASTAASAKSVEDEHVDAEELADLAVVAVVEPAGLEPLEHRVGAFEVDAVALTSAAEVMSSHTGTTPGTVMLSRTRAPP
jgi:hypothetical protein